MTTPQRDRLAQLARNSQPVTVAALVAQWQCSVETARTTLALCGYMPIAGAWHHPDHVPEPEPAPEPQPAPIPAPPAPVLLKPLPPSPQPVPAVPCRPRPQPLTSHPLPTIRRLPTWISVDTIDLLADLEATKVTRTWLLANVEPDLWPHPHRTPCPACPLLQPCLNLSRNRLATICEAVIAQRRIDHANLPGTSDVYRTPARFGPARQEDIRDLHLAENATALAAG